MELLPNFSLLRPRSIAEAVAARAGTGEIRFLAGGTDLLPALRRGLMQATTLVDLSEVAELRGITVDSEGVRIGAGTTIQELVAHPLVARDYPAVAEAAVAIAGPTHRAEAFPTVSKISQCTELRRLRLISSLTIVPIFPARARVNQFLGLLKHGDLGLWASLKYPI